MYSDLNIHTGEPIVWMNKEVANGEVYGYLREQPAIINYIGPGEMHLDTMLNGKWYYFYIDCYTDTTDGVNKVMGHYPKMFQGINQEIMNSLLHDIYVNNSIEELDSMSEALDIMDIREFSKFISNVVYSNSSERPIDEEWSNIITNIFTDRLMDDWGHDYFQVNIKRFKNTVIGGN